MPGDKPKYELAFEDYTAGMPYKDIAAKYEVSVNTVKSWKTRYWNKKGVHTKPEKVCTQGCTPAPQPPPPSPADAQIIQSLEANEELTDKQKLFCLYYSRIFNATQAYLKAYGCSYETALSRGPALLGNVRVRAEVERHKKMKADSLMVTEEDVFELHVRTAFAAMDYFIKWGVEKTPYIHEGKPVMIEDPDDLDGSGKPKKKILQHDSNAVWFLDSDQVDGQLIAEVKTSRDGASIKLRSAEASMRFLENYFNMNPMNQYRMEYEARKLEIELMKIQAGLPPTVDETISAESNFSDALNAATDEVWGDDEDS